MGPQMSLCTSSSGVVAWLTPCLLKGFLADLPEEQTSQEVCASNLTPSGSIFCIVVAEGCPSRLCHMHASTLAVDIDTLSVDELSKDALGIVCTSHNPSVNCAWTAFSPLVSLETVHVLL